MDIATPRAERDSFIILVILLRDNREGEGISKLPCGRLQNRPRETRRDDPAAATRQIGLALARPPASVIGSNHSGVELTPILKANYTA